MDVQAYTIAVIGAGSWGSTLALLLHRNGHRVRVWSYEQQEVDNVQQKGENTRFLPGIPVPPEVLFSTDMVRVIAEADLFLMATPSQYMRRVAEQLAVLSPAPGPVVNVSKGIENRSLRRMSEVLAETLPDGFRDYIVTLSGPSHAEEVSRHIPTVVVAASPNLETATQIQQICMCETFRVYTTPDLLGVELASSLKNIIALAAGISDGLGYGDNAKGALLTRGLAEISRLGVAMGAKMATFAGLAGMGDLITTCMSRHSRNRYVGEQIGRGKKLQQVLDEMVMVAEGVRTTVSAVELGDRMGVELPITREVYKVLFEDKDPLQGVLDLMLRPPKPEIYW
ncbi:MAG: NAD(P)H-dependent glycerol-3-phosphate dehydrogenase [Acidobacteria bacterium]|nr:NAD(P)H-dependent glycerol-3-phosphate dehydrogenase [Acidobacteriota bacterium]